MPVSAFKVAAFRQALQTRRIGQHFRYFPVVASTNTMAHMLGCQGEPEGTVVLADAQTAGRGQAGRAWISPPARNIYVSVLLRPTVTPTQTPIISLLAAVALVDALGQEGVTCGIKWPNDVLIRGRKIAGILTELETDPAAVQFVIVGIGINVNTMPEELPEEATSLAAMGAGDCDPFELTAEVCRRFQWGYDGWMKEGFAPIRENLRQWIGGLGQPVQITVGTEQLRGTATDLDESGRLVVRLDSGVLRAFDMGEVTLLR